MCLQGQYLFSSVYPNFITENEWAVNNEVQLKSTVPGQITILLQIV